MKIELDLWPNEKLNFLLLRVQDIKLVMNSKFVINKEE